MRDELTTGPLRALVPLLLAAAVLLSAVPLLHPSDTCADWLHEWARHSEGALWVPTHQAASGGFMLAALAAVFLALMTRATGLGLLGGAALAGGFVISSLVYLIHATAISALGRAHARATTPDARQAIETTAEAFVAYDMAATYLSTSLVSLGGALLVVHLARVRLLSPWAAAALVPLGGIWMAQQFNVFPRLLGFHLPEALRWTALCLWLVGLAWALSRRPRPEEATAAVPGPAAQAMRG